MLIIRRSLSSKTITARRGQLGLSLVELMVGVALGLFLLAGAVTMFVSNLSSSHTMLLEARINQDMRAAADLITRDIRRTGYWGNSISGVLVGSTATAATTNPYGSITCSNCNGTSTSAQITYSYTQDSTENNSLDSNEQFGYRLSSGKLQMQTTSGTWQDLTDSNILTITAFTVAESSTGVSVASACTTTPTSNTPTVYIRRYDIVITAQAVADSAITRTLRTSVRPRNDYITGACP
jgi:prepilin peptidase dependent protein B